MRGPGSANAIAAAIVALLIIAAPFVLPSYIAFEIAFAGAYAIAILGLIVLIGNNGQISLGHGAFVAIGGYALAIAAQNAGWPVWVTIPLAGIICGIAGLCVGAVALRLTGAYLALATFALAVTLPPIIKRFSSLTGGMQGITLSSLPVPAFLAGAFTSQRLLYFLTWAVFGVLCAVTWWLLAGRFGRALRGLRDNEIAAMSFGIDPVRYKSIAFGLSAAYAGIAGALLALLTAYVSPDAYTLQLSITLLIGAVLGGFFTLWGAVIGGVVVEFLPLWAQSINPAASSIIYGVALIAVMIAMPYGIAGAIMRGLRALRPARSPAVAPDAATAQPIRPQVEGSSRS